MRATGDISRGDVLQFVLRFAFATAVSYYSIKWMMTILDPTSKSKRKARLQAEEQLKRLQVNLPPLSEHELVIASRLVVPEDIQVSWADIAGLDSLVRELRESIVYPIKHGHLSNNSQLYKAPKGVLLHGPPGCGKTLIAKATAKEAGMRFLNLDVSMLTDKWYGESQKLAGAVFSLAEKLQPCIIFIDEIDSFLRSRNVSDHEATAMMKTQFMMLWDGLSTESDNTVIVMGATNRPKDLDKAILRRMPAQFFVGLPDQTQRQQILHLILESEGLAEDVNLSECAKVTQTFSGSDLREMCRFAAVNRLRALVNEREGQNLPIEDSQNARPINMSDLMDSINRIKESKLQTGLLGLTTSTFEALD